MDEKDVLKKAATENRYKALFKEFKIKRNEVKMKLRLDEENYNKSRFHDPKLYGRKAWKLVSQRIKLNFNNDIITNLLEISEAFNIQEQGKTS